MSLVTSTRKVRLIPKLASRPFHLDRSSISLRTPHVIPTVPGTHIRLAVSPTALDFQFEAHVLKRIVSIICAYKLTEVRSLHPPPAIS